MNTMEKIAEKVGEILNAEMQMESEECHVLKKRILNIQQDNSLFPCTLELDISFCHLQKNGVALNKAEIFLLPEELPAFIDGFRKHPNLLPTDFSQQITHNPHINRVYFESLESPIEFAERLASALKAVSEPFEPTYHAG